MSLTITIDFHGLCLFVPKSGMMYVVMPSTGQAAGDGSVDPHTLWLTYKPGDVLAGNTSGSVEFSGSQLVLGGIQSTGADPAFPRGVVNISDYAKGKVSADHLLRNKNKKVEGRFVLPSGKINPPPTRLACWTFVRKENGIDIRENREMTDFVTWEVVIPNPTESALITKGKLDGTAGSTFIKFCPDLTHIRLDVKHTYPSDTWIPTMGDDQPPHFKAYHWVLHSPSDKRRPRFHKDGKCESLFKLAPGKFPPFSNSLYSCMVAGATAE